MAGASGNLQNMVLNTNKAGMEGLNVNKINEIIQKASEGSKFYIHKQKCQERLNEKIEQMKIQKIKLTQEEIEKADREMTKIGIELSQSRDLSKTIVHIDMDMFYAAVEMRDDPSLRDKPMAVGSTGMLSTSNYAARKYGVRAAMPGFIGLKLCPQLVIVPPNFKKYKEVSSEIQNIFKSYDPNFASMSLDEAYLDITNYIQNFGYKYKNIEFESKTIAENIVDEIRKKICEKTQLTASAGIAPNTRLAKVCSDFNKPNGQYYLPPTEEAIMDFVDKLPIRKISGIGSVSEQQLKALGIETCLDLWKQKGLIHLLFSELNSRYFLHISLGLGSTELESPTERDQKSISTETTFRGTSEKQILFTICEKLCKELEEDLRSKEFLGKVFTLKFKTTGFQTRTRAHTLLEPTQSADIMIPVALKLLQHEMNQHPSKNPLSLRLLGVRMSNLSDFQDGVKGKQLTITHLLQKRNQGTPSDVVTKNSEGNPPKEEIKSNLIEQECPVCFKSRVFDSLEDFNAHIILCTERSTLQYSEDYLDLDDDLSGGTYTTNSVNPDAKLHNKNLETYMCPVCSEKTFYDNVSLNIHIDLCLNNNVVKELVKESNTTKPNADRSSPKGKKRKLPMDNKDRAKSSKSSTSVLHKFLGLE